MKILSWLFRGRGLRSRLTTRRCNGCTDASPHTAHLTAYGRRRYTA